MYNLCIIISLIYICNNNCGSIEYPMNELVNEIKKENRSLNNEPSKSECVFTQDTTTQFSSNPSVLNVKTELFLQKSRKRPSCSDSLRAKKSETVIYVLLSINNQLLYFLRM